MKNSEKYLARLKADKDFWAKKVEELPGDTISTNNPFYRMSVNAANKYAAASHMMKLMREETEQASVCDEDYEPITHFFQD